MHANGLVPFTVLVHITGNIWLPAGTAARFAWAFDMAYRKYGVRLRFTPDRDGLGGWNGFRPLSAQKLYRKHYGIMAAPAGFSSHGGSYRGRECFAGDIDNWAELGWARFASIMRLAGLTVDFVSPREQWHVGDMNNPWVVPAFASGGSGSALNPGSTTTLVIPEEDTMRHYFCTNVDGNNIAGWALLNTSWKKGGPSPRPYLIIRADEADAQVRANRWAETWGNARPVTRQAWLDAIDAVMQTA